MLKSGIMYRVREEQRRFRARRQHPRRRPAAGSDHRCRSRPSDAMRELHPRRRLLPDGRHDAALDRRRQPAAGLGQGRVRGYQPRDRHQADDRGSMQTVGIVTDAEPFFRALVNELGKKD